MKSSHMHNTDTFLTATLSSSNKDTEHKGGRIFKTSYTCLVFKIYPCPLKYHIYPNAERL